MGRLILHIGTHKTATTAIQHALHENRAALLRRGVWYPDYRLIGGEPHYAHIGIVNALSGAHPKYTPADAERFFRKVAERVRDHETTLISAEPFYRHVEPETEPPSTLDVETYWRRRAAYVDRVRDLVGPAEIAVVFRRQVDYAESVYQEHVKVTRYGRGFASFLSEFWFHFDYLRQTETWASRFDATRVMRFADLVAASDPLAPFLRALDIDPSGLRPATSRNASMAPDAVILKRMLHGGPRRKDELRRKIEQVFAQLPEDGLEAMGRRSFFRKRAALKAFEATYATDNAALKARFRPDLPDEEPMFEPVKADGRAFGDRLHPKVLGMLIDLAVAGSDDLAEGVDADAALR